MGDPRSSNIRRMEWPPRVAHEDGLLQQRAAAVVRRNAGRTKDALRYPSAMTARRVRTPGCTQSATPGTRSRPGQP